MSPAPDYAKYIGRIGGLAVALGIGVAIANSAALAQADSNDSESSAESTTSESAGGSSSTPDRSPSSSIKRLTERIRDAGDAVKRADDRTDATITMTKTNDKTRVSALQVVKRATEVKTTVREVVSSRTSDDPGKPPRSVGLVTMLGGARREPTVSTLDKPAARIATEESEQTTTQTTTQTDPLATEDQLAAERRMTQIAKTPVVELTKVVLKVAWCLSAHWNFALVGGPDKENLAQLDRSVDEYANQAAMEVQLLNPNDPKLLQQVAPPHTWYGQSVGGTRVWYDNPDTIYRFAAVNAASTYVIEGTYDENAVPADTNFSVLVGLNGETASNLSWDEINKDDDGTFEIIISSTPPQDPDTNWLYLPPEATLVTTRNTLSDKDTQAPMALTITRTSGPPNSLFAQIGGFLIPGIGPAITQNPTLVQLVSLIPPFKKPPLLLQAAETALLMLILGITKQDEYIAVATRDPETGELREPNTLSEPSYNAQFLSNQRQSTGYFQLEDDEALVVTVTPNDAEYFIVPVTNDWTITGSDPNASLNNAHAVDPDGDGTYVIVISPTDPGVDNWVSTDGLNQGTIAIRFQKVAENGVEPTVTAEKMSHAEVQAMLAQQQQV